MALKFEDCRSCRFRGRRNVCSDCDVGELYEDDEAPGVDAVFRQAPSRFGESVTAEESDASFDADRFADAFEDSDDEEDRDEDA